MSTRATAPEGEEVTKEELRQWMDKQWCKPTPLCDLLISTFTITRKSKERS
jgi:hypothetical protein